MVYHLAIQLPHHRPVEIKITNEKGPRRDIDDGARKGFVEGRVAVAEAGEAGARAEGGGEGSAEGEKGILGCVVVVNYRVKPSASYKTQFGKNQAAKRICTS